MKLGGLSSLMLGSAMALAATTGYHDEDPFERMSRPKRSYSRPKPRKATKERKNKAQRLARKKNR